MYMWSTYFVDFVVMSYLHIKGNMFSQHLLEHECVVFSWVTGGEVNVKHCTLGSSWFLDVLGKGDVVGKKWQGMFLIDIYIYIFFLIYVYIHVLKHRNHWEALVPGLYATKPTFPGSKEIQKKNFITLDRNGKDLQLFGPQRSSVGTQWLSAPWFWESKGWWQTCSSSHLDENIIFTWHGVERVGVQSAKSSTKTAADTAQKAMQRVKDL